MIKRSLTSASGIYCFTSKINGKKYIGSAISILRRYKEHIKMLKKGNHENIRLRNHVNKYGIDDLCFSVLELCSVEILITREQSWIDQINPEFNICKRIVNSVYGLRWKIKNSRTGTNHPNFGKKLSLKSIERNRQSQLELWNDPKYKQKMSEVHKGQIPWNKGLTGIYSDETRKRMGKRHKK